MNEITIIQPDDYHHHFRDGEMLSLTVKKAAEKFGKVIVMPNLVPPITTIEMVFEYKQRIQDEMNKNSNENIFMPLMTLYLTNNTSVELIEQASLIDWIIGFKYYPKNATTNSEEGITNIYEIHKQLGALEKYNVPLLIHGETTIGGIDIFDRESVFINIIMHKLIKEYPRLKIVLEHITTETAVDFVLNSPRNIGATITPHHLLLNRNDIFRNGINPHHYCLPILKRLKDQKILIEAATSGNPKFFLGTDSAPHLEHKKLSSCGCAGIFNTPVAIEICASIFEKNNALNKLEAFTSINGANFYRLPINNKKITLIKNKWQVPSKYYFNCLYDNNNAIVPLMSDKILEWQIVS